MEKNDNLHASHLVAGEQIQPENSSPTHDECAGGDTHDHTEGACACGHDHADEGHAHDDGCDCGHSHGGSHPRSEIMMIDIGAVLLVLSLMPLFGKFAPLLAIGAAVIPGWDLFEKGIKSALKGKLDELFLLTVAVIAAIVIGEYFEAAIVTLLFRAGEILEDRAVRKSRREIASLTSIRPDTANLQDTDGDTHTVDARSVPIDSVIQIRPGERVPLDCVVISGDSTVDCSSITGESIPVDARASESTALPSSAINGAGLLSCRTTSDFSNSSASRIISLVEQSSSKKGDTEKFISRFARVYTPIIIVLALALAILPPLLGFGEWREWISRSLVFLVASCPCALVISIPLSFFAGIGASSRRGVIIKGSKYIERLSKVNCAVFDKTGTLTSGKLSVAGSSAVNGFSSEDLLHIASAAEHDSGHPIARAIAAYHATLPPHPVHDVSDFTETSGHGVSMLLDGKKVLCGSKRFLSENGVELAGLEDGMSVYVSVDGKAAGSIEISDSPRPDAAETLAGLVSSGVAHTVMLTGDSEKNAANMAREVGVGEYFAGLLPENKVEHLEQLKKNYGVTLFTGDGINDAPVLASADIGVAMGLGTDAAIEAADVVLVSDRLSALVDAVDISKRTMSIAKFNIAFAISVKVVVLVLGALGLAQMWMAVFADVGVSILAVLNSMRVLAIARK